MWFFMLAVFYLYNFYVVIKLLALLKKLSQNIFYGSFNFLWKVLCQIFASIEAGINVWLKYSMLLELLLTE